QTKVQNLHGPVRFDLDIAGLQIAMDDSFLMRRRQGIRDLIRIIQNGVNRQRTFRTLAFDKFHHEIIWTDIVERTDIRMIQRGYYAHLASESFAESLARDFNRYIAASARIVRSIDSAHASSRKKRENSVRAEALSRFQRFRCSEQLCGSLCCPRCRTLC